MFSCLLLNMLSMSVHLLIYIYSMWLLFFNMPSHLFASDLILPACPLCGPRAGHEKDEENVPEKEAHTRGIQTAPAVHDLGPSKQSQGRAAVRCGPVVAHSWRQRSAGVRLLTHSIESSIVWLTSNDIYNTRHVTRSIYSFTGLGATALPTAAILNSSCGDLSDNPCGAWLQIGCWWQFTDSTFLSEDLVAVILHPHPATLTKRCWRYSKWCFRWISSQEVVISGRTLSRGRERNLDPARWLHPSGNIAQVVCVFQIQPELWPDVRRGHSARSAR